MWKSSIAPFIVVAVLLANCTSAEFSRVDGGTPGLQGIPDAGPVEAPVCEAPSVNACVPQLAAGASCDLVCQTGNCDWCTEKCSRAGDGLTVCSARGPLATGVSCTIVLAGTSGQSDDCAPGNICLAPDLGSVASYCFAHCRSSLDCIAGVACSDHVLSVSGGAKMQVKVCDPPYRSCSPASPHPCCDPLATTASGCGAGQFCYLVAPDASSRDNRTVCDYTTGGGARASQCGSSRDCMQGWTCFGVSTGAVGTCRKVCNPRDSNPCGAGGEVCAAYGNQYGVCPG